MKHTHVHTLRHTIPVFQSTYHDVYAADFTLAAKNVDIANTCLQLKVGLYAQNFVSSTLQRQPELHTNSIYTAENL